MLLGRVWRLLSPGVDNLFDIAGCITYISVNYGRQLIQDIFTFCIAFVLLPHTAHGLFPHVRLTIFLLSILIQQKKQL